MEVMLCPICKEPLAPARRQGVQIDYCRKCRGVWLDRGELDKIIAHSIQHFREEARTAEAQASVLSERQHVYPPVEARQRFMFEQFFDIE